MFCAHNDDQIIGVGGTLAKYAKEGKNVYTYIFSYGESSHPHFNRKTIVETRVKESQKCDEIMGGSGVIYFGLREAHIKEDFKEKKIEKIIKMVLKEKKPTKIFTHSIDDPHPDHRAVLEIILNIIKKTKYKCDIYSFDIWNPINVRKRNQPKMVVDITKTFDKKIKAFKCHKSQIMTLVPMIPAIYSRAMINGVNYGYKYAEVFIKLK